MRYITFLFFSLVNIVAFAIYDPAEIEWMASLAKEKIYFFHVCGSAEILPTKKSLKSDFITGDSKTGYFFTQTPNTGVYWSYLKSHGTEEAKTLLRKEFSDAHLWRYSSKGLEDLGTPSKMEFPFVSSIKACMENAINSRGHQCNAISDRELCCTEKFIGPKIYWGGNQEFLLRYSPDPSVRLKVSGEKKNRFCNFQQIIEIKGSGR